MSDRIISQNKHVKGHILKDFVDIQAFLWWQSVGGANINSDVLHSSIQTY